MLRPIKVSDVLEFDFSWIASYMLVCLTIYTLNSDAKCDLVPALVESNYCVGR